MYTTRRGTQAQQIRKATNILENMISGSNFGILNCDPPTRLPINANPSSPDVSLAQPLLSLRPTGRQRQVLISLRIYLTINPISHHNSFKLKKANWDRYRKEIRGQNEQKTASNQLPKRRKDLVYYHSESSITPYTLW